MLKINHNINVCFHLVFFYFRPNNNEFYKIIDSMPEIKPRSKKSGVLVSDLVSFCHVTV